MGGSRRTRSSKPRGSSQPPSGSTTTLHGYFKPSSMSEDERDKMAPTAPASSARQSPQRSSASPPLLQSTADLDQETEDRRSRGSAAVSPLPPLPAQGKHPCPPQDVLLGLTANPYTQCSQAFPQLLRTMSDPSISLGGTASPTPSLQLSDFPPLPGPENMRDIGLVSGMNYDRDTLQPMFGPPLSPLSRSDKPAIIPPGQQSKDQARQNHMPR